MTELVRQFARPLDPERLRTALSGEVRPSERLAADIDLSALAKAISAAEKFSGSEIDGELVEPLHLALSGLTKREAADMRVWHWLTVNFQELVWRRWPNDEASWKKEHKLSGAAVGHFLGKGSLNGVSRNTLARLWWVGEQLSMNGDYDLARRALSNQEMFQAIYERRFGLYAPAARACLAKMSGLSIDEIRVKARWLQQCLSTTVLEDLTQDQIEGLLDESPPISQ